MKFKQKVVLACAAAGVMMSYGLSCIRPALAGTVTVQNYDRQTIKGWGCFPSYSLYFNSASNPNADYILNRPGVQQAIYNDLGITMMRVEMSPWYYDGSRADKLAQEGGRPYIETLTEHIAKAKARNPNIKVVVSYWSPPGVMKSPASAFGRVNGVPTHLIGYGTGDGNSAPTAQETDYCNWIATSLKYLTTKTGAPFAVSFANEPTFSPDYPGCAYDSNQYVRVSKKLRSTLNATAGLSGVIMFGPEGNHYGDTKAILYDWWGRLLSDTTFANSVGIVATHSYDEWASPTELHGLITQFNQGANNGTNLNKDLMNSEYNTEATGASGIDDAIEATRQLARELTSTRLNYYIFYSGYSYTNSPNGSLTYGLVADNTSNAPIKTKTYHALSRLWKNAPPNFKVRGCSTDDPAIKTDAFYSSTTAGPVDAVAFDNGSRSVVLLVNPSTSYRGFNLAGLRGSTANLWTTTDTANNTLTTSTITGGSTYVGMPPKSVVVVASGVGVVF